jgi:hypothetical protein
MLMEGLAEGVAVDGVKVNTDGEGVGAEVEGVADGGDEVGDAVEGVAVTLTTIADDGCKVIGNGVARKDGVAEGGDAVSMRTGHTMR